MTTLKCCDYLQGVLDMKQRKKIVSRLVKNLKPRASEFDAIAVSGYSMSLIAPIVAQRMGKELLIVRKKRDEGHSSHICEGIMGLRYIIIDDLIASGYTITRMVEALTREMGAEHAGTALYFDYYDSFSSEVVKRYKIWTCFRS